MTQVPYTHRRICPNCGLNFIGEDNPQETLLRLPVNEYIHRWILSEFCPDPGCNQLCVWVLSSNTYVVTGLPPADAHVRLVHPRTTGRARPPTEVPQEFVEDYLEASLVLVDSPKASAALSRRCLQLILREKAGVRNPDNLMQAIEEVIADPSIPTGIRESLDAVRNIGNFASHPNKSKNTGEVVPVEPGEAEWCLDIIEMLFEFYFVGPADVRRRREALNAKLAETGKPNMLFPEC